MKNKYHITITNNETGQIVYDSDICAFIGSINSGAETSECVLTNCNRLQLCTTIKYAERAVTEAHEMLD